MAQSMPVPIAFNSLAQMTGYISPEEQFRTGRPDLLW
jgi:hypothetical protein